MSNFEEVKLKSVNLCVFGETWLSGYPDWLDHADHLSKWGHSDLKRAYGDLLQNSLKIADPRWKSILNSTLDNSLVLVIGFHELHPSGKSIYNSVVMIQAGKFIFHHRKLVPTFTEKLIHMPGDKLDFQPIKLL